MVKYLIEKGATDIRSALTQSAGGGNKKVFNYLYGLIGNVTNEDLEKAVENADEMGYYYMSVYIQSLIDKKIKHSLK